MQAQRSEYGKAEGEALARWPAWFGTCPIKQVLGQYLWKNKVSEHKGARERVSMPTKNSPRGGEPGNEADSQGKRGVPSPGAQLVLGGEGMHVGEKTEFMMLQWAVITKQSTVLLAPHGGSCLWPAGLEQKKLVSSSLSVCPQTPRLTSLPQPALCFKTLQAALFCLVD